MSIQRIDSGPGRERFFEELAEALPGDTPIDRSVMGEILARHDTQSALPLCQRQQLLRLGVPPLWVDRHPAPESAPKMRPRPDKLCALKLIGQGSRKSVGQASSAVDPPRGEKAGSWSE